MEKKLTLDEFSNSLNEAKIDKDFEKLLDKLESLKDAAGLDGEFSQWGMDIHYDSKKTGEISVLRVFKGDERELVWQTMPGTKEEDDFKVKEVTKIANAIITSLKK